MISELMKYYIFDRLDKQIINRIPYCLLFSLAIYLFFDTGRFILLFLLVGSLLLLISTPLFNWYINRNLETLWTDVEFKKVTQKIRAIVEGKDSLLGDIKICESCRMMILAVTSGSSFFLVFVSILLIILNHLNIPKGDFIIAAIILVIIYSYQDLAKFTFFEKPKTSENKYPFLFDLFEMYTINNSLRYLPVRRSWLQTILQIIIQFVSKIIAPLTYLKFPKFSFDILLIYKNPEVVELIKKLAKIGGNSDTQICLKYEDGQYLDEFFTEVHSEKTEKITVLVEKSSKQVFPYLFDPSYAYTEKERKKWIALRILQRNLEKEETVGYIFIHSFIGALVKRKLKKYGRKPEITEAKSTPIFLFIFIGERSYIQYIKTEIEVISTRVPSDIMDIET